MNKTFWFCISGMLNEEDNKLGELEFLVASKEREWKELQAARVHQLEASLKKSKEECFTLRKQNEQLKEDFQFNLSVLDERDRELEKYDVMTTKALKLEHSRQAELSRLHQQLVVLEKEKAREAEEKQELLRLHHHNASQHQLQLDQLKGEMDAELQKQNEEFELIKTELEQRIQEAERLACVQKQEMMSAFESELRIKQHEFNQKLDEMRAVVLSHDAKVKLLSKENDVHTQARLQVTESLEASLERCKELQSQLHHKDEAIKGLTAAKDKRIKEVEDAKEQLEIKLKLQEDEHVKKYGDVARALKKCEEQLEAQRCAHKQQLQRAEKHIGKLQNEIKLLSTKAHSQHKEHQESIEQKEETIQRLYKDVETTRTGWDQYITQVSHEMVSKDTEMITLQEREDKLRTELKKSREEIERYKEELSTSLHREQCHEQKRVQLDLEWQRRCEDLKAEHYLANETLIRDLAQARDQANAELTEKEHQLEDLHVLLRSMKNERDKAVQGAATAPDHFASEEISSLQEQNSILRAVVSQMRKDMDGLGHQSSDHRPRAQAISPLQPFVNPESLRAPTIMPAADRYALALEEEVRKLKGRCRNLEEQLDGATGSVTDNQSARQANTNSDQTYLCKQGPKKGPLGKRQEARVENMESAVAGIIEQILSARQLQGVHPDLQRPPHCPIPDKASTNFPGEKKHRCLLEARLKQAASHIARLSKEKQELIEMGNSLRAQVISTVHASKEPEVNAGGHEEQNNRLSALEQLQYQLTTQELQFALKQMFCGEEKPPEGPSSHDAKSQGDQKSERLPEAAVSANQSDREVEVKLQGDPVLLRSHSEDSLQPLKEIWEMLDHRLSVSLPSEGESDQGRKDMSNLDGTASLCNHKPTTVQPLSRTTTTTKTRGPGPAGKKNRIRNYNVKD
ncbi:coiled-coil domain-containing protein 57 isoform X1 [Synchiropus splendidus]|uniref:coiled-coil domain-containing protein 57 isoform X1 n=3 Tax=Synchiropus splendidus TaxID=270530 RepID=UPI00237D4248|nr:coiled-coil domain-containing protein 57 isoform X1 [Synchiropus splendidus]